MLARGLRRLRLRHSNLLHAAAPLPDFGDSPEALKAVDLFLAKASPAAAQSVQAFLDERKTASAPTSLDDLLLTTLHGGAAAASNAFEHEFVAFATGAISKDRSNAATYVSAPRCSLSLYLDHCRSVIK